MKNPKFELFCEQNKCWMMKSACRKRRKITIKKQKEHGGWSSGVADYIVDSECLDCEQFPELAEKKTGKKREKVVSNKKEKINLSEEDTDSDVCLIEGCDKKVQKRGLCRLHYQHWYRGTIQHPIFGKYESTLTRVRIDFSCYPEIHKRILKIAEDSYLPLKHVVISLISKGLIESC